MTNPYLLDKNSGGPLVVVNPPESTDKSDLNEYKVRVTVEKKIKNPKKPKRNWLGKKQPVKEWEVIASSGGDAIGESLPKVMDEINDKLAKQWQDVIKWAAVADQD